MSITFGVYRKKEEMFFDMRSLDLGGSFYTHRNYFVFVSFDEGKEKCIDDIF